MFKTMLIKKSTRYLSGSRINSLIWQSNKYPLLLEPAIFRSCLMPEKTYRLFLRLPN